MNECVRTERAVAVVGINQRQMFAVMPRVANWHLSQPKKSNVAFFKCGI